MWQQLTVDSVDSAEIGNVGQQDRGLDHILVVGASCLEDGAHVFERLLCLPLSAAFRQILCL